MHTVPRGGETTYHGPGQLVAYPIINLRQLGLGARAFVEGLEDAMVQTAGCFGIQVSFYRTCKQAGVFSLQVLNSHSNQVPLHVFDWNMLYIDKNIDMCDTYT